MTKKDSNYLYVALQWLLRKLAHLVGPTPFCLHCTMRSTTFSSHLWYLSQFLGHFIKIYIFYIGPLLQFFSFENFLVSYRKFKFFTFGFSNFFEISSFYCGKSLDFFSFDAHKREEKKWQWHGSRLRCVKFY